LLSEFWALFMEFKDVVFARKSVRAYADKPVEAEKLSEILEMARWAPSWANRQCTRYIVVTDKDKIAQIAAERSWIKQAPILLVACADPKASGSHDGMDYYLVDAGISMQQLVLAATSLGLGTCWIGAFDEAKVRQVLGVPVGVKVVALTPIGYPADNEGPREQEICTKVGSNKRKPVEEMVHKEKW
jgi:nitroreductase